MLCLLPQPDQYPLFGAPPTAADETILANGLGEYF